MSVLVTGSIAVDHIMIFEDHFSNHFISGKLEKLNVAFHVPQMSKQFGGTGANIAYNLRCPGIDPILLATIGPDLGAYGIGWIAMGFVETIYLCSKTSTPRLASSRRTPATIRLVSPASRFPGPSSRSRPTRDSIERAVCR